jgi:DNA-binding response OmpR family regulator
MTQILVAERDPTEERTVAEVFERNGFEVARAASGAEATALAPAADLLVLALDLPDLDGLEVCRRIRLTSPVPVIGTASPHATVDVVVGLRAGLDAYLVRPHRARELVARAQAILRRTLRPVPATAPISVGPVRIDTQTREVHIRDRLVQLTRKEFDLLYLLAAQPETLFSRRHIMAAVWGDESAQSSRTIDTHVSSLRGKVGDASMIRTVRGVGFQIGYPARGIDSTPPFGKNLDVILK